MGRAFLYLFHGSIGKAIELNPLVLPVALGLALHFLKMVVSVTCGIDYRVNLNTTLRISIIVASGLAVAATWLMKVS